MIKVEKPDTRLMQEIADQLHEIVGQHEDDNLDRLLLLTADMIEIHVDLMVAQHELIAHLMTQIEKP